MRNKESENGRRTFKHDGDAAAQIHQQDTTIIEKIKRITALELVTDRSSCSFSCKTAFFWSLDVIFLCSTPALPFLRPLPETPGGVASINYNRASPTRCWGIVDYFAYVSCYRRTNIIADRNLSRGWIAILANNPIIILLHHACSLAVTWESMGWAPTE